MKINLLKENVIAQKNVMEKEKVMEMGIVKKLLLLLFRVVA